jgi:hypothetical protein
MSTFSNYIALTGMTAAADLSSARYKAVKLASTVGQVKLTGSTTDAAIGILQNNPKSGEACDIAVHGEAKAVMGASVTYGAWLNQNSTGQLKTTTTANKTIVAIALETSTNAGEVRRVFLGGPNRY